jgi:hypothetical protein
MRAGAPTGRRPKSTRLRNRLTAEVRIGPGRVSLSMRRSHGLGTERTLRAAASGQTQARRRQRRYAREQECRCRPGLHQRRANRQTQGPADTFGSARRSTATGPARRGLTRATSPFRSPSPRGLDRGKRSSARVALSARCGCLVDRGRMPVPTRIQVVPWRRSIAGDVSPGAAAWSRCESVSLDCSLQSVPKAWYRASRRSFTRHSVVLRGDASRSLDTPRDRVLRPSGPRLLEE